jgi:hypothetical protein
MEIWAQIKKGSESILVKLTSRKQCMDQDTLVRGTDPDPYQAKIVKKTFISIVL